MGAESTMLGSLITSASGLMGLLIAKIKCVYRHTDEGCQPACACMDGKIEKDNELLETHTVQANGRDLIYVARKASCTLID